MKESIFWKNVKIYLLPILTVLCGSIALIGHELHLFKEDHRLSSILALVILMITVEMVERRRRFSHLEEKTTDIKTLLTNKSGTAKVEIMLRREDAIRYVIKKAEGIPDSVDQASIDRRGRDNKNRRKDYEKNRKKLIESGKTKYRYLAVLYGTERFELIKEYLKLGTNNKFYAGVFLKPEIELPLMHFIIFDKKFVIARYPHEFGKDEVYVVIESEEAAKLFLGYFDRLWEKSIKLKSLSDCDEIELD